MMKYLCHVIINVKSSLKFCHTQNNHNDSSDNH